MNRILPILPLLTAFIVLCMCSCERTAIDPIVEINDEVITLNTYISKYKEFLNQTKLQDNLANRFVLLLSLIHI